MPLTNCPDCSAKVSQAALSCPQCGRPLKTPGKWPGRLQLAGGVLAVAAAPLLAVNPVWCLVAALPGLTLFVAGRIGAGGR